MTADTLKPARTKSAATARATTTASANQPTTRSATRPKATKAAAPAAAKPPRKSAPVAAKTVAAKAKAVTRPTARKASPAKKPAHEPAAFVARSDNAGKPGKTKKPKLVRDSFTMPEEEYALIAALKRRCLNAGVSAKKSEILRAAIANLAKLGDASVVAALRRLEVIKTGRPAKGSK